MSTRTAVVDLTYRCNSPCRYCRWGSSSTPGRHDLPTDSVLLPAATLRALGTERVVFSGGEPLLHPALESILGHYRQHVLARVIITNGLLLGESRRRGLVRAGATGFTFSIDSVFPERYFASRGWKAPQLERVLSNVCAAARAAASEPLELSLNVVVTRATATWENVDRLLDFAESLGLQRVKFQPLFDDGYVSQAAPWLLLDSRSVTDLEQIASELTQSRSVETNPPAFWRDLAAMSAGERLPPARCGLGIETVLVARGRIARCYWVPDADVGEVAGVVSTVRCHESDSRLQSAKMNCVVDARCFCLQSLDHDWRDEA